MSTITYPYYVAVHIDSGQMPKLMHGKKFKTYNECLEILARWGANHSSIWESWQIAILEYTNTYESRIKTIFTNGICTNIKLEKND